MPQVDPLQSESTQHYRVRFLPAVGPGETVLREFPDPYPQPWYAVIEALGLDRLPPATAAEGKGDDGFELLFLPGGSATPPEQQRLGEQWMAKPPDPSAEPTVELIMRSDRILWRSGRCLIQGAADRLRETAVALADWCFYEGQLRKLERDLDDDAEVLARDVALTTAAVDKESLRARPHAHERACTMTQRRIRFTRLLRPLEKAPISLSGASRRLFSELLVQCEIQDRLRAFDNRLEVYEDTYELANDRLLEYGNVRAEAKLEIWIIVILVVEVLLTLWDIGWRSHG